MSSHAPTPAASPVNTDLVRQTQPTGIAPGRLAKVALRRRRLLFCLALCVPVLMAVGIWAWQLYLVQQEWRRAEAALENHDLAAAASHLQNYLDSRPRDAAGWFLAARTARRLARYAEAERYLKRCQELGGVTEATRLEWDLFRIQQGDLSDVHTRLRMTIGPEHAEAPFVLEALARGYLICDRLMDALQACDLWAARQPDHPWPWLWRGGIYERLANYHAALADYGRAVDIAPEDRETRLALALLLARARQPGPAAQHFEHLLARDADDSEALLGLAACRIEQALPEQARVLVERVLTAKPATPRALFLRGRVALEQHDAAGAERWLTEAVRLAPDDAEPLHQLTLALRAQRKHAEADDGARRLETLRKDLARLDELIRIIARNPDDVPPRHEAGLVALRLGRTDEGVHRLQGALRARGDHRATHTALAEHFRRQGDPRAEVHERLAQAP